MIGFLYGQTEYNILKNSMHLDDYIKKASEIGYKVLSITDSNMYANYKFYKKCIEYGIKPLIGLEISIGDMTVLGYAKSNKGYKNLCKISSYLKIKGDMDISMLKKYSEDIYFIALSIDDYNKLGFAYGLGIYSGDIDTYSAALENNIKVLPLLNTCYLNEDERVVYQTLCKIGGNDEMPHASYLHDVSDDFKDMDKVFSYLLEMTNGVDVDLSMKRASLPSYPLTNGKSSKEYLLNLCNAGLKKRLNGYRGDKSEYIKRLQFELDVIDKMGYNDYFLIVWDFIKFAKKNGILVGPGRGSAAGSLVAYSIGISSVDPIKYGLYFERFLNPERVTMPDIDTDFPDARREEVINYVRSLYGDNRVSYIGAFGTFKTKSSLRDLGKAMGKNDDFIKKISAQVNTYINEDNESDSKNILSALIDKVADKEVKDFLFIASKMEDLPRHITTHASGIIVSDIPLYDVVAMQGASSGIQTQLESTDCEEIGLLKMDFLGLKNLSIIDEIISQIDGINNINVFNNIPLDDACVYDMLSNGDTLGVFQLEKPGITRVVSKFKPERFEDIVALLALYRPGPMDNIPEFIERRHGKKFTYIHEDLKPILEETYGIIVYQEQIMQIARRFAGYSLGGADILRRAVSKKKESVLISEREKFVSSAVSNGYSMDISNKIYDDIVKFANYGFNKSHSVVYALFAYIMAYFKCRYKNIFMVSLMNSVIGSVKETMAYITYARKNNITILPPDINISTDKYVINDNKLYMPLNAIKGVGKNIANEIITKRGSVPFKSFDEFKERVGASSSVIEGLIYAGAFDSISETRRELLEAKSSEDDVVTSFLSNKKKIKEYDESTLAKYEYDALGINILYNIYRGIDKLREDGNALSISSLKQMRSSNVIAVFSDTRELSSKKGAMLIGHMTDDTAEIPFVIFSSEYELIKGKIKKDILYHVNGVLKPNKDNVLQFVVNEIKKA